MHNTPKSPEILRQLERTSLSAQSLIAAKMAEFQAACIEGKLEKIDHIKLEASQAFEDGLTALQALFEYHR